MNGHEETNKVVEQLNTDIVLGSSHSRWPLLLAVSTQQHQILVTLYPDVVVCVFCEPRAAEITSDVPYHIHQALQHVLSQLDQQYSLLLYIERLVDLFALQLQHLPRKYPSWDNACDLLLYLVSAAYARVSRLQPKPEIEDYYRPDLEIQLSQMPKLPTNESLTLEQQNIVNWVSLFQTYQIKLQQVDPKENTCELEFDVHYSCDGSFQQLCENYGSDIAYHGSLTSNWYSILRTGLHIKSHTKSMRHGAMLGEGIYLSLDLQLAHSYSGSTPSIWSQSNVADGCRLEIVGAFEFIRRPKDLMIEAPYVVVRKESDVRLRKLLIWRRKIVKSENMSLWFWIAIIAIIVCIFSGSLV